MASGFQATNATVVGLRPQEGFQEVTDMITSGKVSLNSFKVIALLVGRADLWIDNNRFEVALQRCITAIQGVNNRAIILLAATLPVPGDCRTVIETSNLRSGWMARLAAKYARLEFSKPGKRLIRKPGGAIKEFFDENRQLVAEGLLQVQRCFEAKITCAHLMDKFQQLNRTLSA